MKKLLLLTTGGTIASVEGENGLAPAVKADELLSYVSQLDNDYTMETQSLMNLDSTNMQPEYWVKIAKAVEENYEAYDGFVITHGTDTMAYTSAALSYMLQHATKPIVITGSQIPITFKKTDAKKNITDAIRFACEGVGGVYVVFDGRVIQGTRAIKLRTKSYDAFESINYPYIAFINEDGIEYNKQMTLEREPFAVDTSLCTDVCLLKLHPGLKPEMLDALKSMYKGIVIESYGSGGIPFEERDLLTKINELIESGIVVVITTQCLEEGEDMSIYEVGRRVNQDLIIRSRNMNTEAIVPKLMWALGKSSDLVEVKKIMETPIADDVVL
ncbi:type I asparaginase [Bacillus atrophaeus]|uniref:asparaginase n=1 Tax=Bacillus atrophaeus (strain 1942) TaxID=720555 RepID=A0ABM5LYI0_BACA1|nr:type I asparaginase [Bacillus atrophaeus]AMR62267.1 L-asparaginase 1 [Bacillus subtilis subsp. globigii]ADP32948.1 L-asparaginase [Bacillus atrophaeus 1942]AIK48615.1 L-asparaginase, type I family protein [Bacillus atrophaeus subsp. globigii]EIM12265.1 L-asparaginase [Bacillus atrophaeus C89]KFK83741.1 L-asparaginase, type I family protein [Bacillus atrophaeus]